MAREKRATAKSTMILALCLLTSACLSHAEDEENLPGSLSSGLMELEEYPVSAVGLSGLSLPCRRVYECACPLLAPEDIDRCRDDVWTYTDEMCRSVLQMEVPECL